MEATRESAENDPRQSRTVHLVLGYGFRSHTVSISMDDHEVFRAVGITTDPTRARAGTIAIDGRSRTTCLAVSIMPGNLAVAFEIDTIRHPQVTISLLGEGTVAFEASTISTP